MENNHVLTVFVDHRPVFLPDILHNGSNHSFFHYG
jgi:hypothetical protein